MFPSHLPPEKKRYDRRLPQPHFKIQNRDIVPFQFGTYKTGNLHVTHLVAKVKELVSLTILSFQPRTQVTNKSIGLLSHLAKRVATHLVPIAVLDKQPSPSRLSLYGP